MYYHNCKNRVKPKEKTYPLVLWSVLVALFVLSLALLLGLLFLLSLASLAGGLCFRLSHLSVDLVALFDEFIAKDVPLLLITNSGVVLDEEEEDTAGRSTPVSVGRHHAAGVFNVQHFGGQPPGRLFANHLHDST